MATVNLRFGLDADSFINGVALVEKQTKSMSNTVERQIEGLARQLHQMRGTTSEYERYRAAAKGATLEQRKQIEATLQAIDAERALQSNLKNTETGHLRIVDSLKAMVAGYVSLQGVASLMRAADTYQGLENRLRLVTDSQLELNQAMNDTREIALRTSMQWESIASIYQRFAQNGEKLGLTMQETAALTDTVAKTAMISGGSMDSVNAALVQFGQALASGVLRGEEFNSIAEQQPALLQAIAKGLNVGVGELRFMASQGMLTADVVSKALQDVASSVDADFGKMQQTGTQALQNLSTRWTELIGEAGKSTGAMKAFTASVGLLSENLDTVMVMAFASGVAYIGKAAISTTIALQRKIAALVTDRQATIAATAAAAKAAQAEQYRAMAELNAAHSAATRAAGTRTQTAAEAALAVASARATAATMAETAANHAAAVAASRLAAAKSMLLGVMGGPVGLIATGLAVGGMYAALKAPAAEVNSTFTDQIKTVEELTQKYKEMNAQQQLAFKAQALQNIDAQKEALESLYSVRYGRDFASLQIDGQTFASEAQVNALIDALDKLKSGTIDGQEALAQLEATKLFGDDKLKDLTVGISKMEEMVGQLKQYNQQLDLANGKDIVSDGVSEKGNVQASLTAEQALDFEAIKKVSEEFALMHANLGLSNEQIKLAALQQNLANLAEKGANEETMRAAQRNADLAQSHYEQMQAVKASEEAHQAEARQLEQSQKFVAEELSKRETLIAQIGKTSEELLNMSLVAAGAAEQDRKKIIAAERLSKEYERQRSAIQTLEDMNKEIARLGKTDTEVKLMDFKDKGATAEQLAVYRQQLEYAEQFKESQKLNEAAVKTDVKTVDSFAGAVSVFDQTVKSQADLQKLSKYEQNNAKWEQIRAEEKAKNQSQLSYYGPGAWYPSNNQAETLGEKRSAFQAPNSDLPKRFTEQVKRMSSDLDNLGVLYLASEDGKDMAQVLASPANAKIIKQISQAGFKDMARDGAATRS